MFQASHAGDRGHYVWRFGDSCKDVRGDWCTGSIRWSVAHDYINAQVFLARDACYLHNYTSPTGKRGQYRDTLECQQSHEQQDEGRGLPWCGSCSPGYHHSLDSVGRTSMAVVLAVSSTGACTTCIVTSLIYFQTENTARIGYIPGRMRDPLGAPTAIFRLMLRRALPATPCLP